MISNARKLASTQVFIGRVGRCAANSTVLVVITLAIGTTGFVLLAHLPLVDAFHQAALLIERAHARHEQGWSSPAKLFDSVYALFCGIVLLVSYGVLFAPIFHRFMHKFHLEDVARE